MRNLTANEDLEKKRAQLSEEQKRPVYICSAMYTHGTHFKRPGSKRYTSLGRLEAFLSPWTDNGTCVKREGDTFYFDLAVSKTVRLVYPLKKSELKDRNDWKDFKSVGLDAALSSRTTIYPSIHDRDIPKELEEYLEPHRAHHHKDFKPGIHFTLSEEICVPEEYRYWHVGFTTDSLITLQGPGKYSKDQAPFPVGNGNNVVGITEREPGDCIVCRGEKKQRRHFGVLSFGPHAYLNNLICLGCAEDTFDAWHALLARSPINLLPKKEVKL